MPTVPLNEILKEEFDNLDGRILPAGVRPLPASATLKQFYNKIHELRAHGRPRSALCLSGGGIRSASFALGVLHGFAERGLLGQFTYLSTVSGGGYIGGWLSTWRQRVGTDAIIAELRRRKSRFDPVLGQRNKDYIEAPEVRGLRAFSNYLTPRLGVMSADTWALAALYIRNLFLNWLIYLPAFIGVLLVPWLAVACLKAAYAAPEGFHLGFIGLAVLALVVPLFISVRSRLGERRRVSEGWYVGIGLLPTYLSAMFLSLYAVGPLHPERFGWLFAGTAGAGLYGITALAAHWSMRQDPDPPPRSQSIATWIAWLAAGGIAGALIGVGCQAFHGSVKTYAEHAYRLVAIFGVAWVALSMFIAEAAYLGVTSYWKRSDAEREWLARSSGWFVAMTLGWAGLAGTALYGPDLADWLRGRVDHDIAAWLAAGAAMSLGAAVARIGRSTVTVLDTAKQIGKKVPASSLLAVASIVFLLSLAIIISSSLAWLAEELGFATKSGDLPVLFNLGVLPSLTMIVVCIALVGLISVFVNVNRFSAHALYRNRLARAYLGSARGHEGQGVASPTRDPFTGFDRKDNLLMSELNPANVGAKLFHVVNMALNVVAGRNNAWQERRAEPFVVTPLKSGNPYVGFVPSAEFGSSDGGLTLGTAMAISGAAASPNQGYHSSPLVGFVMTLFNVRLGWWLGNPRYPDLARREGPKLSILRVLSELFGQTDDQSGYVYLSDGGHFENLGLYEMIRRRCHFIVVSDGGCDPDCAFEDLGNAVRKIWIDLGVSIDFEKIDIRKRGFPEKNLYCALGTVRYPESDEPGYVLYVKPGFHNDGREPADVTAYALANVAFPHETTADQFFSESQLESYRALGAYIIKTILGEAAAPHPDAPTAALAPYWAHLSEYVRHDAPQPDLQVKLVR
jgi:hypothetical protein